MKLCNWAHSYKEAEIKEAVNDFLYYVETRFKERRDGHDPEAAKLDPSPKEMKNGEYRVFYVPEILLLAKKSKEPDYKCTEWFNLELFVELLSKHIT